MQTVSQIVNPVKNKFDIMRPRTFCVAIIVLSGAAYFEKGLNTALIAGTAFTSFWFLIKFHTERQWWQAVAYFSTLIVLIMFNALAMVVLTLFFYFILFFYSALKK